MALTNKQLLLLTIALIMALLTIQQASAEINITTVGQAVWRHVADDLVATATGTYEITYFDSIGIDKVINTTPYLANNIILFGISPQKDYNFIKKEDFMILNVGTKEIVYIDYSGADVDTFDAYMGGMGGWVDSVNCGGNNFIDAFAITDNYIYYTRCIGGNLEKEIRVMDRFGGAVGHTAYSGDRSLGCSWSDSFSSYTCGDIFIDDIVGDYYEVYVTQQRFNFNNFNIFNVVKYLLNETNTSNIKISSITYLASLNLATNDIGAKIDFKGCFDNNNDITCSFPATTPFIYTFYKSGGQSVIYPYSVPYNRNGVEIEAKFIDKNSNTDEMFINATGNILVYDSNSPNIYTPTDYAYNSGSHRYKQFSSGVLLDDAIIYQTSSSGYRFKTFSELDIYAEGFVGGENETQNVTYVTINSTNNFTGSDFRTIRIIENDQVVIGGTITGGEGIGFFDYSNTQNVTLRTGLETELVYSVDAKPNSSPIKISVGTNNGIYSIEYNQISENINFRTIDKWTDLFHQDLAYDVLTQDYNNYVCDGDDEELDYNVEYNDPTDLATTKCYDIERHGEYLYVDAGNNGINVYNATAVNSVTLVNNIPIRITSTGLLYGDLMDIKDDLLVGIANDDEFIIYDISDDSSEVGVSVCDVAGAGKVISVEIISDTIVMAGLDNGKLAVCDITRIQGENIVVYEPLFPYGLVGIEYDGQYIHIIGGDEYIIATIENYVINTTENTPPTLDSYSVSSTNPEINQTVTVTITAGNVEPLDVIRYGIKCSLNDDNFTYNLLGQFECIYNDSGAEQITIAVTDNYHIGTWYDVTTIGITVLPTVFTGGIINVEVIDDETQEYVVGANVTADGNSVFTDTFGRATITTTEQTNYLVTTTATGYYDNYQTRMADGSYYVIRMNPLGSSNQTNIIVIIKDEKTALPIENALVSYTNGITYNFNYGFTDVNGRIIFTNTDSGLTSIQVSATNYEESQTTTTINSGQTNNVELSLNPKSTFSGTLREDRNCTDDGIWICGSPSAVETSCTQDSDCPLTDYCTKGINKCSRFNYSKCDDIGMPRTQKCIAKLTTDSVLGSITNWMLTNLLWVIMIIILIVGAGMIFISWKGK